MKKLFGIFILIAISGFALTGCWSGYGPNASGQNFIGGSIPASNITGQEISFSVTQSSAARNAYTTPDQDYPVSGQLQIGGMVIELEGFYDPISWSFNFSGAAGEYAFEFYGVAKDGKAAGKIKKRVNDEWEEEVIMFDFDPDLLVNKNPAPSAQGLPAEWMGWWDCWYTSDPIFGHNAQLAEQWGTIQDGNMVLTPHSMSFWFDIEKQMEWYYEQTKKSDEEFEIVLSVNGYAPGTTRDEFIEDNYNHHLQFMSFFSVLEVEYNGDGSYDVITMSDSDLSFPDADRVYRKLRFMEGYAGYEDELWIVLCAFDGGGWDTCTEDIATARAGNKFDIDRDYWESDNSITMFVVKSPNGMRKTNNNRPKPEGITQDGLMFEAIDDGNAYRVKDTHYSDFQGGEVTIPDNIDGKPVTGIANSAFANKRNMTGITIPASIISIGNGAFDNCETLASVTFAQDSQLASIGMMTFQQCWALTGIDIPASVESIGNSAFSNCRNLETVTFAADSQLVSIGEEAFRECGSLKSITIPDGVESIGNDAFYYCVNLKTVTIPSGVKTIGDHAFHSCTSLENITIPDGVQTIGRAVFYGCESLKTVTIPSGVQTIGDYAFGACTGITSLTIPSSVTTLGEAPFTGWTTGQTVIIPYADKSSVPGGWNILWDNDSELTIQFEP